MPSNRIPIKNCVVDKSYRPNAYRFIKKQYKTNAPDHNLVRTHAQYKLLCSMEEQYEAMKDIVKNA